LPRRGGRCCHRPARRCPAAVRAADPTAGRALFERRLEGTLLVLRDRAVRTRIDRVEQLAQQVARRTRARREGREELVLGDAAVGVGVELGEDVGLLLALAAAALTLRAGLKTEQEGLELLLGLLGLGLERVLLLFGDRPVAVAVDRLEELFALAAVGALRGTGLELLDAQPAAAVGIDRLEARRLGRRRAKPAADATDAGHDWTPSRHRRMAAPAIVQREPIAEA
jgi:hypothetical protein